MRLEEDLKLDFSNVLIRPKRSTLCSRSEVELTRNFKFVNSKCDYVGIPVIVANMDTVGTFRMADAVAKHNLSAAIHKHYTEEQLIEFFGRNSNKSKHWYSMGITDNDWEKFTKVSKATGVTCLCIDVANGYQEVFVDFIKKVRDFDKTATIMAGNVVTAEMTEALILAGADIVKVGIGPGSVCTTRKMTGVGMPQLSAIIETADAAHGLGGHICSDGGITVPGDLGKAFGAGADFVMMGGAFAGHDECDGEITNIIKVLKSEVKFDTKEYSEPFRIDTIYTLDDESCTVDTRRKGNMSDYLPNHFFNNQPTEKSTMKFYGMSSKEAMEKHSGGVAKHRAAEGKCVEVEYKGPVENTVLEYLGGLRSCCTYVGASKLKELSKRTTFVRVENQINNIFS